MAEVPINDATDKEADQLVENYMEIFGLDAIETKFACCIDGLKKIHRRVLFILGTSENKQKVFPLTGRVMAIHPHGDSAIMDVIIRLAQPFSNIIPLINAVGSVGNFGGGKAAAGRYLPVVSAPFVRDVFFNGTNLNVLTMIPAGDGYEPKYFLPKIPVALIMGNIGIVPGFKSDVMAIGFKETCDLTEAFVKIRGASLRYREYYVKFAKYLIPDHPAHALLRNYKSLMSSYSDKIYNARIIADGVLHITPTSITIKSLPFVSTLKSSEDKIHLTRKKSKDNWFDKHIQEMIGGPDGLEWGDIAFKLKRGTNPFTILDEFKKNITFTRTWTPINTWLNKDGRLEENFSAFNILEHWYNERFKYIRVELKYTQTKLIVEHRKLEALIIVVDNESEVHTIFKTSNSSDDTIQPLCTRFKLTEFQAKYLSSLTYAQITKQGKDELVTRKQAIEKKISQLQHEFNNINARILSEVQEIKKKYVPQVKRKLVLPSCIGYVQIGIGIIQYNTIQELIELVATFGSDKVQIHKYPTNLHHKCLLKDGMFVTEDDIDLPKEMVGECIYASTKTPHSVMCLRHGTVYRLEGLKFKSPIEETDVQYIPVVNKCISISKTGHVNLIKTSQFLARRLVDSLGVKTDIDYISPLDTDRVVIVHGNKKEKNCIRMDLLYTNDSKISKLPVGKTDIIYVGKVTESMFISIPPHLLYRCQVHHLVIDDVEAFFGDHLKLKIALTTHKTTHKKTLVKYRKHPNIWTVR